MNTLALTTSSNSLSKTRFILFGSLASVLFLSWVRKKRKQAKDVTNHSVIILGDIFLDIVAFSSELPSWGCDLLTDQPINASAGGSALNSATHLSHSFSIKTVVWSAIGNDIWGSFIRAHSDKAGVSLKGCLNRISTAVCLVISGDNDRGFLTHRGPLSTLSLDGSLGFDQHSIIDSIKGESDHLHIAGYYNCPKLWNEPTGNILKLAQKKGISTSLNCQYDSTQQWGQLDGGILPNIDFIFLNQDEALLISKMDDPERAGHWFLSQGVRVAVITLGSRGAMAMIQEGASEQYGCTIVQCGCGYSKSFKLVDTTGAGDAFISGFLSIPQSNITIDSVCNGLRWGIATGTSCVGQVGASTMVSRSHIEQYLPLASQITVQQSI